MSETRSRTIKITQREIPVPDVGKLLRERLGEGLVERRVKGSVEQFVLKSIETSAVDEVLRESECSCERVTEADSSLVDSVRLRQKVSFPSRRKLHWREHGMRREPAKLTVMCPSEKEDSDAEVRVGMKKREDLCSERTSVNMQCGDMDAIQREDSAVDSLSVEWNVETVFTLTLPLLHMTLRLKEG